MKTSIKAISLLLLILTVTLSASAVKPSAQKGKAAVGKVDSSKGKVDKQSSKGGKAQGGSKGKVSSDSGSSKGKGAGSVSLKLPPPPAGVAVETFTVNGVTFEMVRVDGGSFMMGSDYYISEQPVHFETVGTFWIGRTEVTQALWEAVMEYNYSLFKRANLPVESVSWNECQVFLRKLNQLTGKNFHLPSEAEWEYAARGGNRSQGYKYSGSNDVDRVAWFWDNSDIKTHPVATKLDNELGLYDMSGNVREWCNAAYNCSCRVLRGGSWDGSASYCRVATRNYYSPGSHNSYNGMRLAL